MENGGQSCIRVQDDGAGIAPGEELELADDPSATSASRQHGRSGTYRVLWLPWRGPAGHRLGGPLQHGIRRDRADSGTEASRIVVEFGRLLAVEPSALHRGTIVEVRV